MEGKIFGKAPEIDLEVEKKHQKASSLSDSCRTCCFCS